MLSDPKKRAVYDQYGEEGLKGVPPPGGGSGHGTGSSCGNFKDFHFNPRNAEDIFAEFFGSSPFGFNSPSPGRSMKFQTDGGMFGGFSGGESMFRSYTEGMGPSTPRKPPPVENKLACSLEELYIGSKRKMKISRNIVDANG